jgi:hypothetical protein
MSAVYAAFPAPEQGLIRKPRRPRDARTKRRNAAISPLSILPSMIFTGAALWVRGVFLPARIAAAVSTRITAP